MHTRSMDEWTHAHDFLGESHDANARRIWLVVAVTTVMMVAEIAGGTAFGSLALVADGWHMSTHAAALGISAAAYLYARRHTGNDAFSFGTGKFGDLAAFTSAVVLGMIALLIAYESILRISDPVPIAYGEAVAIATVGLVVNLVSAWLLSGGGHGHHHEHADGYGHHHHHGDSHGHDNNLRSAYIHVLADAFTSVLAIAALLSAWRFGWTWIDPAVGLIGAAVIASWAFGLMRNAGAVLLDVTADRKLASLIRRRLERNEDRVSDLHLWQIGPGHRAAVISIVTHDPQPPAAYKRQLADLEALSHVTVEVERCGR
jgi:cation diffusion facilitator family transporter